MKIAMHRIPGAFVATTYEVENIFNKGVTSPKLCAGATTRLFKLPKGTNDIVAIITKSKPQDCGKYYEIVATEWHQYTGTVKLKGYGGGFMGGTYMAIKNFYNDGYRFVRVEPRNNRRTT